MSPIQEVTMYSAICDGCGENLTARGDYSAWADPDVAAERAVDDDGFVCDGFVLCSDCINPYWSALDDAPWDALYDKEPEAVAALKKWLAEKKQKAELTHEQNPTPDTPRCAKCGGTVGRSKLLDATADQLCGNCLAPMLIKRPEQDTGQINVEPLPGYGGSPAPTPEAKQEGPYRIEGELIGKLNLTRAALVRLADIHHRTIRNSRKHDSENRDWADCDCGTCQMVQLALRGTNGDQNQAGEWRPDNWRGDLVEIVAAARTALAYIETQTSPEATDGAAELHRVVHLITHGQVNWPVEALKAAAKEKENQSTEGEQ